MNWKENTEILARLSASFPNWHPESKQAVAVEWFNHLGAYPKEIVQAAVEAYIDTDESGFAPSIGQIKGIIRRGTESKTPTAEEAWTLVSKALRNSTYGSEEEFAKLPPIVQRAVGSPANLKELASMNSDTVHSVEKSLFTRTYNNLQEREHQNERIPERLRKVLNIALTEKQTANQEYMALPESADEGWDDIIQQRNAAQNAPQITQNDDIDTFRQTDYSPKGDARKSFNEAMNELRAWRG